MPADGEEQTPTEISGGESAENSDEEGGATAASSFNDRRRGLAV